MGRISLIGLISPIGLIAQNRYTVKSHTAWSTGSDEPSRVRTPTPPGCGKRTIHNAKCTMAQYGQTVCSKPPRVRTPTPPGSGKRSGLTSNSPARDGLTAVRRSNITNSLLWQRRKRKNKTPIGSKWLPIGCKKTTYKDNDYAG